ncbi:CD74 molecule, major histocompatibility complex, class II invariant chain b [Chaetodon auriga]|uniref:CD74 molecule, major histocompatibility complex, class II invariant chain b n=1 Tax=Chaetodon auriga TaxID=39042 RepID=UPI004032A907
MSDPETQTQPLIGSQAAINVPSAQNGRSSKAYKVAGLTLLACVLIAGQAMIAYFLLSQRSDIRSLEEQNDNLKTELTRGRSGQGAKFSSVVDAVPVRMHVPMKALPALMDDSVDEEASTGIPEKPEHVQATDCQLEAAGLKAVQVPGFRPSCDERGLYLAKQCYGGLCWCVNPANGMTVPGSVNKNSGSCSEPVLTGSLSNVFAD